MNPDSDADLLQAYLEGELEPGQVAELESRLKAEPALCRQLVLLAREETVLSDWARTSAQAKEILFDPYYTWLGIPPEAQPANHYSLLGLRVFEENREAIEHAADRQMAHLRTFQAGKHGAMSQKLLNEVAAAKITLLSPEKKTEYDHSLRAQLKPKADAAHRPVKASPLPTTTAMPVAAPLSDRPECTRHAPRDESHVTRSVTTTLLPRISQVLRKPRMRIGIGIGAGAIALLLVGLLMSGGREESPNDLAGQNVPPTASQASEPPSPQDTSRPPHGSRDSVGPAPEPSAGRSPMLENVPAVPSAPDDRWIDSVMRGDPQRNAEQGERQHEGNESPPVASPPRPKTPIPSAADQQRALAALNEVYELGKERTGGEKIALARELLKLGREPGPPADRFVVLRKAMETLSEAGDAGLMLEAVDAIGRADFDFDVLDAKTKVMTSFAAAAKDPARMKSLVDNAMPLIDDALAEKRHALASQVVRAAQAAAEHPAGAAYRRQLADRSKEVEDLGKLFQAVEQAEATLRANPDDPDANLAMGRWHCLVRRDWRVALPHLAKGSDVALRQAAAHELAPPATPDAMVAAGDAWWELSEKAVGKEKDVLTARAVSWYDRAHAVLPPGLAKTKIERRIDETAQSQQAMAERTLSDRVVEVGPGSLLPQGVWVDLASHPSEPRRGWSRQGDAIVGDSRGGGPPEQWLPVHVTGSYDLQFDCTWDPESMFVGVNLPLRDRRCSLLVQPRGAYGLGSIDGRPAWNNPTTHQRAWEAGKEYHILAKVRVSGDKVSIETLCDGQPLIAWNGQSSSLEVAPTHDRVARCCPTLLVQRGEASFRNPRIRLVSGDGAVLDAQGRVPEAILAAGNAAGAPGAERPRVNRPWAGPVAETVPGAGKHPIPPPDEQQRILAALNEIHDLSKERTNSEKIQLAKELINLGGNPQGVPAERFVLLRKSMELASEAGDASVMLQAADGFAIGNFDVDPLDVKAKFMVAFAEKADDSVKMRSMVDNALPLADRAISARRFDVACQIIEAAYTATEHRSGAVYRKQLADRLKQVQKYAAQGQAVEQALTALQANPDDPKANLVVGRWHCLMKNDWKQGLPYLAKGSDEALRTAAAGELASPPTTPDAMVAIGDGWWNLAEQRGAEEKDALMLRAGHWYGQAKPNLDSAIAKIKVEKRLEEIAKIGPALAGEVRDLRPGSMLPRDVWVDLLKFVRENEQWSRHGDAIVAKFEGFAENSLPVHIDGDYDLQVDFTRHATGLVSINLPIADRLCSLLMHANGPTGLGRIDGQNAFGNPTARREEWEQERKYSILCKVRTLGDNATIEVQRDGQPMIQWGGKLTSLDFRGASSAGPARCPRLAIGGGNVTFDAARLRLVSGTGALLDANGNLPAAAVASSSPTTPGAATARPEALSLAPVGRHVQQNAKGVWRLEEGNGLRLNQPVDSPWTLEFDFVLPEARRGFSVTFGPEGESGATMVSLHAGAHGGAAWRNNRTGERVELVRIPREAMGRLQPGQTYHARIMAKKGGFVMLLNNQPAMQANHANIDPAGTITIVGFPAEIGNLTIKTGK